MPRWETKLQKISHGGKYNVKRPVHVTQGTLGPNRDVPICGYILKAKDDCKTDNETEAEITSTDHTVQYTFLTHREVP